MSIARVRVMQQQQLVRVLLSVCDRVINGGQLSLCSIHSSSLLSIATPLYHRLLRPALGLACGPAGPRAAAAAEYWNGSCCCDAEAVAAAAAVAEGPLDGGGAE
jgi:hypothetical protein